MKHDRPPSSNQRKKEQQHGLSYIHVDNLFEVYSIPPMILQAVKWCWHNCPALSFLRGPGTQLQGAWRMCAPDGF